MVMSDTADQPDLGAECPQHCGDTGGSAEPVLAMIGTQKWNRRFLADPFGEPPDIAVEDQIAHDRDSRATQILHALNQIIRHVGVLVDSELSRLFGGDTIAPCQYRPTQIYCPPSIVLDFRADSIMSVMSYRISSRRFGAG
jgi:hypothetical protein